ncbi:hypothetical protein GYMLUDRAFT_257299 [Collybiopsis luxurians FD-317 M1]|nr:hypothetical protein GYMLUDRAFT_257299 [Collybiopsis luxurians FD-317 M1]
MPGSKESTKSTKTVQCFNQLVQKSKMLFSFSWVKHADGRELEQRNKSRQHSSNILDLMQPRPSLSTNRISRPIRPGSRPGIRSSHAHSHPHGRQFSRSEVDVRLATSSRPSSLHPPRFGSVVRRDAPRYSTFARPTHSTVMVSSDMEDLLIVNVDGTLSATSRVPDTPPAYPGLPGP